MRRKIIAENHPVRQKGLETLAEQAIDKLSESSRKMAEWVEKIRPKDGARGKFHWAVETTRDANVASTAYMLGSLKKVGVFDRIITDEDKREGIVWVRAMEQGNKQHVDPALYDRKSPNWPENEPWPSPAMRLGVTQYAQSVLRAYGEPDVSPAPPPQGWPQVEDADKAVDWIKSRPWDTNPWGAGSHSMRMATWLLQWYKEGRISIDPLINALKFFYKIQDPETGLWGTKDNPMFQRINGTFKLFPLMCEQLDLPLPHAGKIIDNVMSEFYRPDYDEKVGGCDEWDNWYVVALALEKTNGHRVDEIRKMAAYRIIRVLEIFSKPDGGLSYSPDACQTAWIGFDMAPAISQADACGLAVFSGGLNVCIDILGIQDKTSWTGRWRLREDKREPLELRQKIESLVFEQ